MDHEPYKKVLDQLLADGESALDKLLLENPVESFFFDFKESTSTGNKLSDSDKRNLAKAMSGFSNTSGGLLIWGVREKDKTFFKQPVPDAQRLAILLNENVSRLTQPILSGVNSFPIIPKGGESSGYVVTEIPKNYLSPVQVITDVEGAALKHRYYIRAGSDFVSANHDMLTGLYNRQRSSRMICAWSIEDGGSYQENDKIISCRFGLILQNKGVGIIRDIWVNFSASGIGINIEQTKQTGIFSGWTVYGQALNLVTKDDYKCAPQHTVHPFIINVVIKKEQLPDEAWFYFSFGADQVAPYEKEVRVTKKDLIEFINSQNKNAKTFLQFLGLSMQEEDL